MTTDEKLAIIVAELDKSPPFKTDMPPDMRGDLVIRVRDGLLKIDERQLDETIMEASEI